ncbi:winged helix-turn-helix transcriptional regulator [Micromonosporaceae bacterium DT55]|uniref:winged helix-turn-helix transcriptional regulator n=1 Tax=Melissospora conviva TaxID=3388432 RepID=UPI003C2349E5
MAAGTEVRECSVARTLEVVGEKWTLLAVRELMLGNSRFEQITRYTGAPRDILTTRLRKLEANGLLERVPYQERPTRYEYRLTRLGWSLAPLVTMMRAWGDAHLAGPEGPPVGFLHSCGAQLTPVLHCATCQKPLRPEDVRPAAEPAATAPTPGEPGMADAPRGGDNPS